MYSTLEIKQAQLRDGSFAIGPENAAETILIMGSCRSVAYLNYLGRYNEGAESPLRLHFIDPFNWNWNAAEEFVNYEQAINALESDERILSLLRRTTILIHEHYKHFGMFNTSLNSEKNIYQFGLNARQNICIPNFHDRFVLIQEQADTDKATYDLLEMDVKTRNGWVGPQTIDTLRERGLAALEKFYSICRLSDFPELENEFRANWTKRRFFWTGNHVSREFTLFIMRQMNERFLHLPLDGYFWNAAGQEDQFASPCTRVTRYDISAYNLQWPSTPIEPLKL